MQVQVLNYVVDDAAKRKSEADYTVIMIITDGGISDMAETKAALVALSRKPVSVVLVRRKPSQHTSYKTVQHPITTSSSQFSKKPHGKSLSTFTQGRGGRR